MMTFDEFAEKFGSEFAPLNEEPIHERTGLFDELDMDSLSAFRMILFIESLADVPFPPDEIPPMYTVADSYDYYLALCTSTFDQ